MDQTTLFQNKKQSQSQRILYEIKNGRKNTNWELAQISLNYTMRISELRRKGHNIIAVRQKVNGKNTGTFRYFLKED